MKAPRTIKLTAKETEGFERNRRPRGWPRRFAEADLIIDANGRVLKSKDGQAEESLP
ncbi:hypothetical protein MAUB1S_11406 [Mycolicibacterium aubagnense]